MRSTFIFLLILLFSLSFVSSAHFVVGRVHDALDGTAANGRSVVLWNPSVGTLDNLTDVIGPSGNAAQNNLYLLDCELLVNGCSLGDELSLQVLSEQGLYGSEVVNVTITGAGFDLVSNVTLNSPPIISSLVLDDGVSLPSDEIDLLVASTRRVTCEAIVEELDGNSLQNISAELFDTSVSFYGDGDDNNYHYTNASCVVDEGYGTENESAVACKFPLWYYANPETWRCVFVVADSLSSFQNESDTALVNELLAVGFDDTVDFGLVDALAISSERVVNVTNYGNVMVNLSLSGYGASEGDGAAMVCDHGTIPLEHEKYNLSSSFPGTLSFSQLLMYYSNLTSTPVVRSFNLAFRSDDFSEDTLRSTYWRMYVPTQVAGSCSGSLVFGAVKAQEG